MQSVSSRIWTRVAVSISYDDNHYTTGTYDAKVYPVVGFQFFSFSWSTLIQNVIPVRVLSMGQINPFENDQNFNT